MIDILIPTYKRPEKIRLLIENIKKTSTKATPLFIIRPDDKETEKILINKKAKYLKTFLEYMGCINLGVKKTSKPFIFCGADDIEFTKDWDLKLLEVMKDEKIMVTGGIDDWTVSQSGVHTSHPLVRRTYLGQSYWNATTNDLYCPEYNHYQGDIELEQLAHYKNVIKVCKDCIIHHNHYVNGKATEDTTYTVSRDKHIKNDTETFLKRKANFEFYDVGALHSGKAIKLDKKRHSIIMPIWNCKNYVIKTVKSLVEKTKYKYELIMIDDNSTEFDGSKLLNKLKLIAYQGGFCSVKILANNSQKYCNYNWNKGVELATGDYISIINSDIEFETAEWDDYIIENLDMGYQLVNPYERNKNFTTPFGIPPQTYFLNINHIKGCCFSMTRKFADSVFPIPKELVHWFGDTYISDKLRDTMFDIRVVIFHHGSKSSSKVNNKFFWELVYKDCLEYEKIKPEGNTIKQIMENNLKFFK
jgi:hypothetical protein